MLVRPFAISEAVWVGSGAVLLVLFRLIPFRVAGRAIAEGEDVYFFLFGMMLLSELAKELGVFDWLSSLAVRKANGSCVRLLAIVYGIGTVVTVFMSNDATAVVLTPAILSAVKKAKVRPLPYLFACALVANAASFALPISNPANLVVFHQSMPALPKWLGAFAVPSLLSIASTYLVLRLFFRKDLAADIPQPTEVSALNVSGKLVLGGIAAMAAVLLTASALDQSLGLPTCITALAVATIVSIQSRRSPWKLCREISWGTLALVAGLFVMVAAVESIGALGYAQRALQWAEQLPSAAGAMITSLSVGAANNAVNNLPLGLIAGATIEAVRANSLISNAVLIGVDLGPNLCVTGSLATILWLIALRKEGLEVSFWDFLKVGALAMPAALIAATAGLILMHMIFPA